MKKYLICYVTAGGGHYSMAKNIKRKLEELDKNVSVELYDVLRNSRFPQFADFYDWLYVFLTEKTPLLWNVIIKLYSIKPIGLTAKWTINRISRSKLREKVWRYEPDVVISTYYFVGDIVEKNKQKNSSLQSVVLVSDIFSPHAIWFLVARCTYFVLSTQAHALAMKYTSPNHPITQFRYVYDERFTSKMKPQDITLFKLKQGINTEYPTLCILSGGSSLKGIEKLYSEAISHIETSKKHTNIIVICGRNKNAYNAIKNMKAGTYTHSHIFGFSDSVYELINCSTCVISKAGPATMLEVLSQEKKFFINSYIPDQEKGNKDFVIANKVGEYQTNPTILTRNAVSYCHSQVKQTQFNRAINHVSFPNDTTALCEKLLHMAEDIGVYNT